MPYTVRNTTNAVIQFSLGHNDNVIDSVTIPPQGYYVGEDLSFGKFTSDSLESSRFTKSLFDLTKDGTLSIKDADGNDVTYDQYTNPPPP